jgi:hypothetical protein
MIGLRDGTIAVAPFQEDDIFLKAACAVVVVRGDEVPEALYVTTPDAIAFCLVQAIKQLLLEEPLALFNINIYLYLKDPLHPENADIKYTNGFIL